MTSTSVSTDKAPAAIGPYSQAVMSGGFVFISGQIPLNPASGEVVAGGFQEQAARVLDNFQAVVEAAGATLDDVVKTTVYVTDIAHFQEFNNLYALRFGAARPARAVVQVSALPRGVMVEMEGIAALPAQTT